MGVGMSHYPGFTSDPTLMGRQITGNIERAVRTGLVPDTWRNRENWPEPLQQEYGSDEGVAAALKHRELVQSAVVKARDAIDAFKPDFVLIWGDDQWENFHDDIVPPFAVYIWDEFRATPLKRSRFGGDNYWKEPIEKEFVYKGHTEAARYLVNGLMDKGFPMPYSYQPLHNQSIAHAHLNTLLYLDDDRRGWPYPVIQVHINCYGDRFVLSHGGGGPIAPEAQRDPKGPSPAMCFELGRLTAQVLRDSPWRCVVVGSSSWSHGGLTKKHAWIYPDVDADRALFEHLSANNLTFFRDVTTEQLDAAGQLEVPNWCALAGAMFEIGQKADVLAFAPTYIFNSSKAVALFRPPSMG